MFRVAQAVGLGDVQNKVFRLNWTLRAAPGT